MLVSIFYWWASAELERRMSQLRWESHVWPRQTCSLLPREGVDYVAFGSPRATTTVAIVNPVGDDWRKEGALTKKY